MSTSPTPTPHRTPPGAAERRRPRPRSPRATSGRAPLAATEYVAPPPPMLRDPGRVPNTAILWCRRADGTEGQRGWIHAYDANAMYLAAQGATEVGVGAPEYHRDGT